MKELFEYSVDSNGCWISSVKSKTKAGYALKKINGKSCYLHRLSYAFFNGEIPNGLIVRHTCDVPSCINPSHLILGTHKDNNIDTLKRNRRRQGTQSGCKLSENDVREIRLIKGFSYKKLAEIYSVSSKTISLCKRGLTWQYLLQS